MIIYKRVTLWSKIPWLFLWIVSSVFKASQLILKIKNIVSLLISKSSIFIFSKYVDVVVIFLFSSFSLNSWVFVNLSYRIVSSLLGFYFFTCNFNVRFSLALEVILGGDVVSNIMFPIIVIGFNWEEHFIRCCLSNLLVLGREHAR